jgi:hypothetical protein
MILYTGIQDDKPGDDPGSIPISYLDYSIVPLPLFDRGRRPLVGLASSFAKASDFAKASSDKSKDENEAALHGFSLLTSHFSPLCLLLLAGIWLNSISVASVLL